MKKVGLFLLAVLMVAGFAACSSDDTKGFDEGDISITAGSAVIKGTTVNWSATLTNVTSDTADLDLQIKLKTVGASSYFYTSPMHSEKLGGGETRTYTYADTGVALPSGSGNYEYMITFVAVPD